MNNTTETWKGHWSNRRLVPVSKEHKISSSPPTGLSVYVCIQILLCISLGCLPLLSLSLCGSFPQGTLGIVVSVPTGTSEGLWEMSWQYQRAGDGEEIPRSPPGIGREREKNKWKARKRNEKWEHPEEGLDEGVGVSSLLCRLLLHEPNWLI